MAVDDPVHWHKQNLEQNPTHYSFLRYSGPKGVAAMQKCAGQIYYNTRVEMNGKVYSLSVLFILLCVCTYVYDYDTYICYDIYVFINVIL